MALSHEDVNQIVNALKATAEFQWVTAAMRAEAGGRNKYEDCRPGETLWAFGRRPKGYDAHFRPADLNVSDQPSASADVRDVEYQANEYSRRRNDPTADDYVAGDPDRAAAELSAKAREYALARGVSYAAGREAILNGASLF